LHAKQADRSADAIDLLGESVEWTVHDFQETRGDGRIDFQGIGQIVHGRFGIVETSRTRK
jgi:hypothetical protein